MHMTSPSRTIPPVSLSTVTHVHAGNSLFELLQLLELWTPQTAFLKAAKVCTTLHHLPGGAARTTKLTGWELGMPLVLQSFAEVLGSTKLIAALDALEGPYQSQYHVLAKSFGVCSLKRCFWCGELLYLRSACLACGEPQHCKTLHLHADATKSIYNDDKIAHLYTKLSSSYMMPDTNLHPSTPAKIDFEMLEDARKRAITVGITYLDKCGRDDKVFKEFGGDIMFLFRNLVHTAGGSSIYSCNFVLENGTTICLHAACYLHSLVTRWTAQHMRLSNEIEMEEILNIVEALHVLAQLGIKDHVTVPPPGEIMEILTVSDHPIAI